MQWQIAGEHDHQVNLKDEGGDFHCLRNGATADEPSKKNQHLKAPQRQNFKKAIWCGSGGL